MLNENSSTDSGKPPITETAAHEPGAEHAFRAARKGWSDEALTRAWKSRERCDRCRLAKDPRTGFVCVESNGAPMPEILVVGDAPAANEDQEGMAFVGPVATYGNRFVAEAGVPVEIIRWTKSTRCFPRNAQGHPRDPDPVEETAHCLDHLWNEIEELKPKVIIAQGTYATRVLTGESISDLDGQVRTIDVRGRGYPLVLSPDFFPRKRHETQISRAFATAYDLCRRPDANAFTAPPVHPISSFESNNGTAPNEDAISTTCDETPLGIVQATEPGSSVEEISLALAAVTAAVTKSFPGLEGWTEAVLTVFAVRCFKDVVQPTVLIGVGPPSAGKSTPLTWVFPTDQRDSFHDHVYRSDKFTAQSFVSHRADLSHRELNDTDLLPKIKDKVLVTKELSPIFRGKRNELVGQFSMLTSILDGQGFQSDSGAQGRRGYSEPTNFCWLGATTPLSHEAFEALQGPGAKIFFYDVDRPRKSVRELSESSATINEPAGNAECARLMREFLNALYRMHPLKSIERTAVTVDEDRHLQLAACAELLARLRATFDEDGELRIEHCVELQVVSCFPLEDAGVKVDDVIVFTANLLVSDERGPRMTGISKVSVLSP